MEKISFKAVCMKSKVLAENLQMTGKELRKLVTTNKEAIGARVGHYWSPKQVMTIAELRMSHINQKPDNEKDAV
jgi:hypothetical protein